jgi:tRNA (guanine10-N2)-dimethyltransferase
LKNLKIKKIRNKEIKVSSKIFKKHNGKSLFFFLLSGENQTLPFSEVKNILEAQKIEYNIIEKLTQVIRIQANYKCVNKIFERSALTRVCYAEIFSCKPNMNEIFKHLANIDIDNLLIEDHSFAVRVKRIRNSSEDLNRLTLERNIGEKIVNKKLNSKIDLKKPQKTLSGILVDNRFLFGLKIKEKKAMEFIQRGVSDKDFAHSAAMPPKIARCMINLTQPKKDCIILDPFCGTGSFLVEACLIGCKALGIDVKRSMIQGTQKNLELNKLKPEGLLVGDARNPSLIKESVDCIATDPPYGTSATTLGMQTKQVYKSFFSAIHSYIKKESRICLAAPRTINVKEIGNNYGFKHIESHFYYIHRNLTREIAVFKKL